MKKKIIILMGICLLLTIFTIYNKSQKLDVTNVSKDKKAISVYVENVNGEYEKSSGMFPSSGYVVNTEKSYCVNGSTISSKTATCNLGDINEDGKVNTADASFVSRVVSGALDNNSIYQNCGDVDADGALTDEDATMIRNYASKLITTFTKGDPLTEIEYEKVYTNMKTADECYLYFDIIKESTLSETITALTEERDETKAWQVINENGYRYEGDSTTENNLCLDEECAVPYRIIGVFETPYDADSDGTIESGETDYLVKVVRTSVHSKLAWNSNETNDWTTATLNNSLNSTTASATVNVYANMSEGVKSKIAKARWYLGNTKSTITASASYTNERSSSINDGNSAYHDNYIGLIYPSDYGYAPLASSCRSTIMNNYSNYTSCYLNNWLYSESTYWTISPDTNTVLNKSIVYYVFSGGVSSSSAEITSYSSTRESFYLIPSVKATGNGSNSDPYVLAS